MEGFITVLRASQRDGKKNSITLNDVFILLSRTFFITPSQLHLSRTLAYFLSFINTSPIDQFKLTYPNQIWLLQFIPFSHWLHYLPIQPLVSPSIYLLIWFKWLTRLGALIRRNAARPQWWSLMRFWRIISPSKIDFKHRRFTKFCLS